MYNNSQSIYIDRVSYDCILSDNKFVKIYNFLLINNYKFVRNAAESDIIMLDLCWVSDDLLKKSHKRIQKYILLNKKIVLLWCISDVLKKDYKEHIINIDSKTHFNIEKYFDFKVSLSSIDSYVHKDKITIIDTDNDCKEYSKFLPNFQETAFIEISNWCRLKCTYCNIKKIKGETTSLPISEIISSVKSEIWKWKKEIYLLSDDCWSYWFDIWVTFPELLDEISEYNNTIKIHISNIYPAFLVKYYDEIKRHIYSWQINHILVPTQHYSDRILSHMKRWYDTSKIISVLKDIKENSHVELHNHIIFNYNDETLGEFVSTFKYLPLYDKTYYFKYSDINKVFEENKRDILIREKITLLKKLQNKYHIDISY